MKRYFWYGIINAFFFVIGLWVGGIMCGLQPPKQVEVIYPSPVVYFEGKRSEPGKLAPETINAIEIQTAKNWFERDRRDPMERVK